MGRRNTRQIEKTALEMRNEYYRQWRAANPEKVKQANQNYWRRKAEKALAERQRTEE